MLAVVVLQTYGLESIYLAAWALAALSAAYLGKWTIRGLMLYVLTLAVLLTLIGAARTVLNAMPRTYTVSVPYVEGG